MVSRVLIPFLSVLVVLAGCSSGDDDSAANNKGTVGAPTNTQTMTGSGGASSASGTGGKTSTPTGNGAAGMTAGSMAGAMAAAGTGGMTMMPAGTGGVAAPGTGGSTGMMPMQPAGPEDGDASKPVVAIDGVACRNPSVPSFGASANLKVDDRDVILDYPCDKHEGAPMTFILNLHGTTPVAQHFYQRAISRHTSSSPPTT